MKPLSDLQAGEAAYVVDLRDEMIAQDLLDIGCIPGERIVVQQSASSGDLLKVIIKEKVFYISRGVANSIITHVVSLDLCMN